MFGNYAMRAGLMTAIAAILLIVFGIGECFRCIRSLLPASTVTMAEVTGGTLAGRGYVRVTGAQADMSRVAIVVEKKPGQTTGDWKGAYVGITDASAGPAAGGMCNLVAWMPHARSESDIETIETLGGPNGDELVGFVDGKYDPLSAHRFEALIGAARIDPRNCWIVDVRKPSWLKGMGLTVAGLAIPTAFVLWKRKQPVGRY